MAAAVSVAVLLGGTVPQVATAAPVVPSVPPQVVAQNIDKLITQTPAAHEWNTEVLQPLQAAQAAEAAEEARKAAEAARLAAIAAEKAYEADIAATANRMAGPGAYGSSYAWGNCTSYVASRISVPDNLGNANTWAGNLLADGWRSGGPRRGAIAQTSAGWAGHVAVVEQVSGDQVLVSEMNWEGLDYVDQRWTNSGDWVYLYQ